MGDVGGGAGDNRGDDRYGGGGGGNGVADRRGVISWSDDVGL